MSARRANDQHHQPDKETIRKYMLAAMNTERREFCDCCGGLYSMLVIHLAGTRFLCPRCRSTYDHSTSNPR